MLMFDCVFQGHDEFDNLINGLSVVDAPAGSFAGIFW